MEITKVPARRNSLNTGNLYFLNFTDLPPLLSLKHNLVECLVLISGVRLLWKNWTVQVTLVFEICSKLQWVFCSEFEIHWFGDRWPTSWAVFQKNINFLRRHLGQPHQRMHLYEKFLIFAGIFKNWVTKCNFA